MLYELKVNTNEINDTYIYFQQRHRNYIRKTFWRFLKKLQLEPPHDPVIPILFYFNFL